MEYMDSMMQARYDAYHDAMEKQAMSHNPTLCEALAAMLPSIADASHAKTIRAAIESIARVDDARVVDILPSDALAVLREFKENQRAEGDSDVWWEGFDEAIATLEQAERDDAADATSQVAIPSAEEIEHLKSQALEFAAALCDHYEPCGASKEAIDATYECARLIRSRITRPVDVAPKMEHPDVARLDWMAAHLHRIGEIYLPEGKKDTHAWAIASARNDLRGAVDAAMVADRCFDCDAPATSVLGDGRKFCRAHDPNKAGWQG